MSGLIQSDTLTEMILSALADDDELIDVLLDANGNYYSARTLEHMLDAGDINFSMRVSGLNLSVLLSLDFSYTSKLDATIVFSTGKEDDAETAFEKVNALLVESCDAKLVYQNKGNLSDEMSFLLPVLNCDTLFISDIGDIQN